MELKDDLHMIWYEAMKLIYECYPLCQSKNNVIEYAMLSVIQVHL